MNNLVLDKVEEIVNLIKNSDDYQKYLLLQDKMNNDVKLLNLIDEVKRLQKEIVYGKEKENELKEKMNLLDNNPLYREYNNTLSEINNRIAIVENTLNNYFDRKLNEE